MGRDFGADDEQSAFSRRALLLGLGQAAAFVALGGRLYQLQVMDGARYAPLAENNRSSIKMVLPVRGRILDRNGTVLAANKESFRLLVRPSRSADMRHIVDLLNRIVPIDPKVQKTLIMKSRQRNLGRAVVIADDLTFQQVAEINLLAPQLPGVETETAYTRIYPMGANFAHVTGYLGSVEKRALDDDRALQIAGIRVGKTALERDQESQLRGVAGARRFEVDARGRTVRALQETAPVSGSDMMASTDARLQMTLMQRLARERRAAAVVLSVGTGEILAMGSFPSFDPEGVSSGKMSKSDWRSLTSDTDFPMLNRATNGLYPPGSIFKLVTALAALEAGVTSPDEKIECDGTFEIGSQSYRCWNRHGHRATDLHKALRESCDVYFYEMAQRVGIRKLSAMARRLGFGETEADGIVLEKAGVVPGPDWKRWRFGEGWSTGDTILSGIGQGYVLSTPMQLAVLAARLASGKVVIPTAFAQRSDWAASFANLLVSGASLDAVRAGMIGVVNEDGGTGGQARIAGGPLIAGKTGTSQVRRLSDDDEEEEDIQWPLRDHALFVSYFPAEAPRYAVAAVVEHGGGGGTAAAPLVKDIIEMLLALDPLRTSQDAKNAAPCCAPVRGGG